MEIFASVLIALITTLFGPLIVTWTRVKFFKKKPDPIAADIIETEKINAELEDILNYLNADRVWITQLHNGGHFLHSNKSLKKFSVVYEADSPGISAISNTLINIPITLYSALFKELVYKKLVIIKNVSNTTSDTFGLNNIASGNGTVSCYMIGMFDFGTEQFIGMFSVDFLDETELDDVQMEYLTAKVGKISGYLSAKFRH